MPVRIRLTRMGRANTPAWRVAVFDRHTRRDGRYLEMLGTYLPKETRPEKKLLIDLDRYHHWVSRGAVPTEALTRLLKHTKILETKPVEKAEKK